MALCLSSSYATVSFSVLFFYSLCSCLDLCFLMRKTRFCPSFLLISFEKKKAAGLISFDDDDDDFFL